MSKVITNDEGARKDFKERALKRVQELSSDPFESLAQEPAKDVYIPSNYFDLSDPELYGILKYQELTPEQANTVVNQLRGQEARTEDFRFVLQSPFVREESKLEEKEEVPELEVSLPEGFESLKAKDQFLYLKTELLLTVEQANDVMFALADKAPRYFKVILNKES